MTTASATATEPEVTTAPPVTGWAMLVAGVLGALASAMLLIDRITQLKDQVAGKRSSFICDLSSHVSCSSVMSSKQAEIFGFPSPVFGLPAFAALATLGLLLVLGVGLPRIVWLGLQVGVVFGICFVTWLQWTSIHVLGELCPWCMVVWAGTIPVFVLVTTHVTGWRLLRDWTGLVIALWYLVVIAAIAFHFYA